MSQNVTPPRPPHAGPSGSSAAAAAAAVLSLTRAARSFALYDPANKVVRQLIGDYREKVRAALDAHGALTLQVHPFELMLGAEQVYLEKDRERSLAFRLFRDGVREITFLPSVTWEELLRLLEVLSVRFTGVRQQEDDLVTLLRKAELNGIVVSAIEGYAPEEEQAEPSIDGPGMASGAARFDAPVQWDVPLPPFSEPAPLRPREIDADALARLRSEEGPERLPEQALRAALDLIGAAGTLPEREAAEAFAREVREYLLIEGRADLVAPLGPITGTSKDPAASLDLGPFLLAQPVETREITPDLATVLDAAGDGALDAVLDLVAAEAEGPRLPFLLQVALHVSHRSADTLEARLQDAPEPRKGALLLALAEIDPAKAVGAFVDAVDSGGLAIHVQALSLVERVRPSPASLRLLRRLLVAGSDVIRLRAIRLLPKIGGPRAFAVLQSFGQDHAASAGQDELAALGQALVESDRRAALELFQVWVRPASGLLGRLTSGASAGAHQRAALAGLAHAGGDDSAELLQQIAAKGDPALRAQAAAVLAGQAGAGPSRGGAQHG